MVKRLLLPFMVVNCLNLSAQSYSGGSGTSSDPFLISNKTDLQYLSEHPGEWGYNFKQIANISFTSVDFQSGSNFYNAGAGFIPIGNTSTEFYGSYNGAYHFIDSVYMSNPPGTYIGFFGDISTSGTIQNLGIRNINITDNDLQQISCGGFVGYNQGTISNSYSSGSVTVQSECGGFAGYSEGTINACYSTATVNNNGYTGGFVGASGAGLISNCYSSGAVTGCYTGGFVGNMVGPITNCFSTGLVTSTCLHPGGFDPINMIQSPATNCFWDTQSSGQGFSNQATGLSTAQMQTDTTFINAGWDFVGETANGTDDIWTMGNCAVSNNGYPMLSWQGSFSGGDGSSTNPYQVSTKTELKFLSENSCLWNKNFVQTADIVFDPADFTISGDFYNNGHGFRPIGIQGNPFLGSYDGQHHTIEGVKIINPSTSYAGFFGSANPTATLTNIALVNATISSGYAAGSLCGYCTGTTINYCSVSGSVSSTYSSGGIAAFFTGNMHDCYSTANVSSTALLREVNARAGNDNNAIQGTSGSGGLLGLTYGSTVINCYSTGTVAAVGAHGGLIGVGPPATIANCFWDTQTSGQAASAGGTGQTTAQMQTETTFTAATWDFVNETANGINDTWKMGECSNHGYPVFAWQSTLNFPTIVSAINDTICYNTTALLLAGSSYGSINWYTSASGSSSLFSGNNYSTTALTQNDTLYVEADTAGCISTTRTMIIGVVNAPLDTTSSVSGVTIVSSAIGVSYQWIDCNLGTPIAGETNSSFTATSNGTYACIVSNNSCSDTTACTVISAVDLAHFNPLKNGVNIYPNPGNGTFTVVSQGASAIVVYNALGEQVYKSAIKNDTLTVDLSLLANGVYTLQIENKEGFFSAKYIKQ